MIPAHTEIFTGLPTEATWVGPYPRLATADEDASYAEMHQLVDYSYPGILLDAAVIDVPTMTVTIQHNCSGGLDGYLDCYLIRHNGSAAGDYYFGGDTALDVFAGPDEWVTHTFNLVAGTHYDKTDVEACIATGDFAVLAFATQAADVPPYAWRYSQIAASIGPNVPPPLRQKQRDDGLGRSVVRARSAHSVQQSIRQRGYR